MRRYAIDINEIEKGRPSEKEVQQKLARYEIKEKLGLFELFDETDSAHEKNIIKAGFKSYAEYEELRLKALSMIDNDIPIPAEIAEKLMQVVHTKQKKVMYEK